MDKLSPIDFLGGTTHVGLVSGRTAIPDLQELARHMSEAVDELEKLA